MIRTRVISMAGMFCLLPFCIFDVCPDNDEKTDAITEVKKALAGQVQAWNNQDLEKAISYYWNSPDIIWISRGGVLKGYQPVLEDFEKSFADRGKMGIYSYEPLHIEEISRNSVYFVIRWKIVLNGQKILGGVSSQIWKKMDSNWVITAEHAS